MSGVRVEPAAGLGFYVLTQAERADPIFQLDYGPRFFPCVRSRGMMFRNFFRKWGSLVAGLRTAWRPLPVMDFASERLSFRAKIAPQ
jgi:hypothetical protein